jgi:hypothetical protein
MRYPTVQPIPSAAAGMMRRTRKSALMTVRERLPQPAFGPNTNVGLLFEA